ncbi:hypothetical protein WBJ53_02565 [Spirosoma sp. SC4-14]|uniref:hypothetical protein n=1 Tax=Spirosoma sp. SC4-14 TaxID=3128900 RepID=UPI0030D05134
MLRNLAGHQLYTSTGDLCQGIKQKFIIDELATGMYQVAVIAVNQSTIKTFVIEEHPAQTGVSLQS